MSPSRPYLLRAIFDWLIENDQTPYLLVDAEAADVMVPVEHVQDGKIILNISLTATRGLELSNDAVSFNARFSGLSMDVYVPIYAALALYSKENGRGMMFPEEGDEYAQVTQNDAEDNTADKEIPKKPHLTIVK
jgi:stringent starvation protein B